MRNFLTPKEILWETMLGLIHHNRVPLEGDLSITPPNTKKHFEVDSMVLFYAELGECLFHIGDRKNTVVVNEEEVCNNCHVLEDTDLASSENNIVRERFEVSSSVI